MEERIKKIFSELYCGLKTKQYLSDLLYVNPKTIENTIAKDSEEIIYDKDLKGYRFKNLLPKYIPMNIFMQIFQNSIDNQLIKKDFLSLSKIFDFEVKYSLPMINTIELSSLAQKIIMAKIAIQFNCVLKITYFGNNNLLENKYVRPHTIIVDKSTYYLYGSYDPRNEKNIGEYRSFAFNAISDISPFEYVKNEIFFIDKPGNAYGLISKDKFIKLQLKSPSSNYFKREGLFNKDNYDFISEEPDGSVVAKMYYNNIQEIVNLMQTWMPWIVIKEDSDIAKEIYRIIYDNSKKLLGDICR